MSTIDLSNYSTSLYLASSNAGDDGNVYFDHVNGTVQFFDSTAKPTLDLTSHGGGANDTNPLDKHDGLKFEALYAFENLIRRTVESERPYDRFTEGTFKNGGAYKFVFGRKFKTTSDEKLIRGSGWDEYDSSNTLQRVFFGNKGLGTIEAGSQPYYQLGQYTTAVDYSKTGQFDEAILVYDYNSGSPVDNRSKNEYVSVRTYGNTYDRKSTADDLGITELGGYFTGFAVSEFDHLTTDPTTMPFADVWTTPTGAWANMTLEKLATAQTVSGFAEGSGNFTWKLNNPDNSTLDECIAYLDAAATATTDIDSGSQTSTIGKDVDTWYTYNASGQVVTRSGADNLGLYIENIPVEDQQRIIFTNDAGTTNSYQFTVGVNADIGAVAKADSNAWYHSYFAANFNTSSAVTVKDSSSNDVKGNASSANTNNVIAFGFDYDGDTVGGTAGTDKDCVFLCEGDGGATQAKTLYTITRSASINFACQPGVENNA